MAFLPPKGIFADPENYLDDGKLFSGSGGFSKGFNTDGPAIGLSSLFSGAAALASGPYAPLVAIGANLIGNLSFNNSESKRLAALKREQLNTLKPLEARQAVADFGFSQSEGGQLNLAVDNVLADQADRGVFDSSVTPLEVAQVTADAHQKSQARGDALAVHIASAKQAIAEGTSSPGTGAAFGSALGDAGGLIALRSGIEAGRNSGRDAESLLEKLKQQSAEFERMRYQQPAAPPVA